MKIEEDTTEMVRSFQTILKFMFCLILVFWCLSFFSYSFDLGFKKQFDGRCHMVLVLLTGSVCCFDVYRCPSVDLSPGDVGVGLWWQPCKRLTT